jgi:hypothetical protein
MKRFLIFLLLLIPLASAYEELQTLTQDELDAINTDLINAQNLQCQIEKASATKNTIHIHYSCLDIFRYNETTYIIYRKQLIAELSKINLAQCRKDYSYNTCLTWAKNRLHEQATKQIDKIRQNVKSYQTGGIANEFINELEDYNPFV